MLTLADGFVSRASLYLGIDALTINHDPSLGTRHHKAISQAHVNTDNLLWPLVGSADPITGHTLDLYSIHPHSAFSGPAY